MWRERTGNRGRTAVWFFTQSSVRSDGDLWEVIGLPSSPFSSPPSPLSLSLVGVLTSSPLLRARLPVGEVKYWRGNRQSNATNLAVNPIPTSGVFERLPQWPAGSRSRDRASRFSHLRFQEERKRLGMEGVCWRKKQDEWRKGGLLMFLFLFCCVLVKIKLWIICLYISFLDPAPGYPHTCK